MADFYWLGTTSTSYNNGNNWSLTSGGSAAGAVPSAGDTAIFDSNSSDDCDLDVTRGLDVLKVESDFGHQLTSSSSITLTIKQHMEINKAASFAFTSGNIITFSFDKSGSPISAYDGAGSAYTAGDIYVKYGANASVFADSTARSNCTYDFSADQNVVLVDGVYPNIVSEGILYAKYITADSSATAFNTYGSVDILQYRTNGNGTVRSTSHDIYDYDKEFFFESIHSSGIGEYFQFGHTTARFKSGSANFRLPVLGDVYTNFGNNTTNTFNVQYHKIVIEAGDDSTYYCYIQPGKTLDCNELVIRDGGRLYGPAEGNQVASAKIKSVKRPTVQGDWNFKQIADGIYESIDNIPTLPVTEGGTGLNTVPVGRIPYGDGQKALATEADFTYDATDNVLEVDKILSHIVIKVQNDTGSTIPKGQAVYVNAEGTHPSVAPALATDSTKMPSIGLAQEALATTGSGYVCVNGIITVSNTIIDNYASLSDADVGKTLYVSETTAGNLTKTKPTSPNDLVQNVGKIADITGSNVKIIVSNIGRSNDVPNTIDIEGSITSSGDLTLDRGSATSSLTRTLTIGGARNATGGTFAEIDFKNYDSDDGASDYSAAKIRAINSPDGDDDGLIAFYTANNGTLATSPALSIDDTGYVRVGPSGDYDAPLAVSQNTTTTGPSGNAQLVVKPHALTGQDASIEVRGARNSSTASSMTSIKFTNYDNDLSSSNILGAIIGKVTNTSTNVGNLILQTSADGSALSDRLTITSAGNVTIANDLTVQGDFTVSGTTTTLNTQTIEVEDNIIQLNTTQGSPDTATAAVSGIEIYRGNGVDMASFKFDDGNSDRWRLYNGTANMDFYMTSGVSEMSANSNTLYLTTKRDQDDIHLRTGTTETTRLYIDGGQDYSGYVGIGTTAPDNRLHVNSGTSNGVAKFESTDNMASIAIADNDTTIYVVSETNYGSFGGTNDLAATNLNIHKTTGNVGIGTTAPDTSLHIIDGGNVSLSVDSSNSIGSQISLDATATGGNEWRLVSAADGASADAGAFGLYNIDTTAYRLVVKADGNVGIGTTSPDQLLHVSGGNILISSTLPQLQLIDSDATNSPTVKIYNNNGNMSLRADSENVGTGGAIEFTTSGNEKMRLTDAGRLGIGTTSPDALLHVDTGSDSGTAIIADGDIIVRRQSDNTNGIRLNAENNVGTHADILFHESAVIAAGNDMYFAIDSNANTSDAFFQWRKDGDQSDTGSALMTLTEAGNLGIGTTDPDAKLHVEGSVLIDAYEAGAGAGLFFREGFLNTNQPSITVQDHSGANPDGLAISAYDGISFRLNATEAARFTSAGDLALNTTSAFTVGQTAQLTVAGGISWGADNTDLSYFRRLSAGKFQWQTYNSGNTGEIHLQPYGGSVGIGTTVPAYQLEVVGSTDAWAQLAAGNNTAYSGLLFGDSDANAVGRVQYYHTDNRMQFYTNASEKMRITGSGDVGIGVTGPATKLEVDGTITATGLSLQNGRLDYGGGVQQAADLAVGWYTFAVLKGRDASSSAQRAYGEFLINDVDSGRHGSCRLNATHFFGSGNSIQVFAYNFYSTVVFNQLRIKEHSTYSGAALQVYVSNANNNLESYMTMSEQNRSWDLLDTWLADSDDAGHDALLGYAAGSSAWTNFAAAETIDLSVFAVPQGGIYTTGGLSGEELDIYSSTGIAIQTANSAARHKRIFATTSNDGSPWDEAVYYSRGSTGGWSGQHTFTVDKNGSGSDTGYEALRIRDSGNGTSSEVLVSHVLGVGTTSPDTILHVSGVDPVLKITDTTGSDNRASIWLQESDSYGARLAYESSGNDFFNINIIDGGTETTRMVVDRYGRVGIGLTNPSTALEVASSETIKVGNARMQANQFSIFNTAGYGQVELGGSSGAFIDLKNDSTDDFDVRFITTGTNLDIITGNASSPINLKTNGTTRMAVKDDRIELAKNLHFATGTTPKINGGNQNPLIIYGNTDGNPTSTSSDYVTWSTASAVEIRANSSEQTVMRVKDNKEVDFFGLVNGPGRNEGAYGANSFHFGDTGDGEADDWYEVFRWSPNAIMTSASSPQYRNFAARFNCVGRGIQRINFDIYVRGEYGVQDSNGWWAREFIIDGLDETTDDDGNASPDADSIFKMVYNSGTSLSYPYASLYMRRDENWEIRTCNLVSMYTNCVFEFLDNNVGETTPTNDGNTGSYDLSPSIRRKLFVNENNQLINGVGGTAIYFDDTNDRLGIGNSSPATLLDIKGAASNAGGTYRNHLSIIDTAAYNTANAGGSIILGGVDDSGGGTSWWAKIAGEKANTTDGNQSGILNFYTRKHNAGAPISRMVIDEDGNVTVGTTGAAGKLYLSADDADSFIGWNVSGSDITLAAGDDLILHADDDIFFQSGGSTQMTFLNTGELGIGTTTPEYKLDVQSGTIRILPTISSNAGTAIRIGAGGNSNDITLLRIDGSGTQDQGESDSAHYGFSMKYMGSGSAENNRYAMFMDNNQGTAIEAMSILQDGKVGIGVTAPTDTLAISGGIKIGEFNSTDGTGYAGTSPPSDHNNSTGASDPQIRVAGRTSDQPGIIQMAFFDANNFFGGTNEFVLGRLQYAMNENSNSVTTVAELRGVTSKPNDPGHFDGALTFWTSQGDGSGANLTEKMRLSGDGYLGIGTDSPDRILEIQENGTGAAYLRLSSTNTSYPSDTIFGGIEFYNADASGPGVGATIDALSNGSGRGGYLQFRTDPDGSGSPSVRMTIDENGLVGIGETSPSTPLHIKSTTTTLDNLLTLENNGASGTPGVGIKMFSNVGTTNYLEILHDAFGATNFKTTNGASSYNKQMHLQSDGDVSFEAGDVGVGTASPNQKLTVEGSMSLKEQTSSNSDTASYGQLWVKTASPNQLWFTNDTGIDIQITDGTGVYVPSATVDFKPAVFMDSGNVNVTQTVTTIPFDTEVLDPSSNAALVTGIGNDGKIRLTAAGYYQISYSIPINDDSDAGGDRTRVYVVMETDNETTFTAPNTVAQSRAQVYTRENSGGSGLSTTFIYNHTANDYIRLRIDAEGTTDISTETNQSQITIQYLGT